MVAVPVSVGVVSSAVSVGTGVLLGKYAMVCVSVGVMVAVADGAGVGEGGVASRATAPVIIKETQAIDNNIRTMVIPK
jgi:hypothetical protein